MKIHPSPYDQYVDPPTIMAVLDSIAFFWLIVSVTLVMFSWLAWKLWQLHSIPKRFARERGWRQARLMFWLTLLGLIWKPLWILAVILVVTDWEALADWIRRLQHPPRPAPEAIKEGRAPAEPSDAPESKVIAAEKEASA
jgi:hypothetical protein